MPSETRRRRRSHRRHTHKRSAATSPLLLQTFWTGKPLSRLERAALQSYVNQGYTVDVYTYNPLPEFIRRLPPGAHAAGTIRVHDARVILPESALFEYGGRADVGKRSNAYRFLPFSDLFRFTMLHKNGGAWMDLDIFLTRPIPTHLLARPYVFSSERTIQKGAYRKAEPQIVDMGFIKVPGPGSPLTTWILDHMPPPERMGDPKTPFDYMNLYRKAIAALGLERYVLPAHAFLPLNWWDVKNSFGPGTGAPGACLRAKYGTAAFCTANLRRPDVYGVHWFRAILRKKGLPYETTTERTVTDNLYEAMIADIEDQAGLSRNVL
jgi:hypothetical protein